MLFPQKKYNKNKIISSKTCLRLLHPLATVNLSPHCGVLCRMNVSYASRSRFSVVAIGLYKNMNSIFNKQTMGATIPIDFSRHTDNSVRTMCVHTFRYGALGFAITYMRAYCVNGGYCANVNCFWCKRVSSSTYIMALISVTFGNNKIVIELDFRWRYTHTSHT